MIGTHDCTARLVFVRTVHNNVTAILKSMFVVFSARCHVRLAVCCLGLVFCVCVCVCVCVFVCGCPLKMYDAHPHRRAIIGMGAGLAGCVVTVLVVFRSTLKFDMKGEMFRTAALQ